MIAVSQKWIEYEKTNTIYHIKATLVASSTLELTDEDFMADTVTISDATSDENALTIGAVITNTFQATLNNFNGKFSSLALSGALLRVQIGVEYEDGTSEYINRGIYTIDDATKEARTISITAYDLMDKLNVYYTGKYINGDAISDIHFPVSAKQLVKWLCEYCGVSVTNTFWSLPDFTVPKFNYDKDTTCRQVISWVLQCVGGFARMDENGHLVCSWYTNTHWGYTDADYVDGGEMWGEADTCNGGEMWTGGVRKDGGYMGMYTSSITNAATSEIEPYPTLISGVRVYMPGTVEEAEYYTAGQEGYILTVQDNPLVNSNNISSIAERLLERLAFGYEIITQPFRPFRSTAWISPTMEPGDRLYVPDYKNRRYFTVVTNIVYHLSDTSEISLGMQTPEEQTTEVANPTTAAIATAVRSSYEYILTNKIEADVIKGGTLTLGGANNANGSLKILNSAGEQIGSWDNTGAEIVGKLYMTGGSMQIETDNSAYNYITLTYNNNGVSSQTRVDVSGIHCRQSGLVSGAEFTQTSYSGNGMATADDDGVFASFGGNTYGEAYLSNANKTLTISLVGSTGKITCVSLTQTSKEEFKENIVPFESRGMGKKNLLKATAPTTAIDLVMGTDIYEYNYKDIEDDTKHYGVIIDGEYNCCNEIKAEDGVDTYSMVSVLWQAVKELKGEWEKIKNAEANISSNEGNTQSDSGDIKQ